MDVLGGAGGGLTKGNLLLSDPSSPLTTRSPSRHRLVDSKRVFPPNGSSTQRANTQDGLVGGEQEELTHSPSHRSTERAPTTPPPLNTTVWPLPSDDVSCTLYYTIDCFKRVWLSASKVSILTLHMSVWCNINIAEVIWEWNQALLLSLQMKLWAISYS